VHSNSKHITGKRLKKSPNQHHNHRFNFFLPPPPFSWWLLSTTKKGGAQKKGKSYLLFFSHLFVVAYCSIACLQYIPFYQGCHNGKDIRGLCAHGLLLTDVGVLPKSGSHHLPLPLHSCKITNFTKRRYMYKKVLFYRVASITMFGGVILSFWSCLSSAP